MFSKSLKILILTSVIFFTACTTINPPAPEAHYRMQRCVFSDGRYGYCRVAAWATPYWHYGYWRPWYPEPSPFYWHPRWVYPWHTHWHR